MSNLLIASRLRGHSRLADSLRAVGHTVLELHTPEELLIGKWKVVKPEYIFFTHWSHRIPADVHTAYECIIFHMADLPFGRGGSPLQNQISRGIETTMLCALRCVEDMDAGPVYARQPLSLLGTADEILERAADLMLPMMHEIVQRRPVAQPQVGEATVFSRRTQAEGNLAALRDPAQVFDYIRMLDGALYPPAFIETDGLIFEFTRASLKGEHVIADVKIRRRKP
jgi:methionyl-tRNA formyltransferase